MEEEEDGAQSDNTKQQGAATSPKEEAGQLEQAESLNIGEEVKFA